MEIDNFKREIGHPFWPEFSYFNTLNFPQPFTKVKFRTVDVPFIASPRCTPPSSEKKARLIQCDRMLRVAMPLLYKVPWHSQGLLIIFHFKVFSQRAKKAAVCQGLWLLLLHQAVISVITEQKQSVMATIYYLIVKVVLWEGRVTDMLTRVIGKHLFVCFALIFYFSRSSSLSASSPSQSSCYGL